MGILRRRDRDRVTGPSPVPVRATVPDDDDTPAVGVAGFPWGWAPSLVARQRALLLPTVSRSRDILAALIGSCPIGQFAAMWNGENLEQVPLPPEPWMMQPDPNTTRSNLLAYTFDDLYFYGRAFWHVTSRDRRTGLPASYERLPAAYTYVSAKLIDGNVPVGPYVITFQGLEVVQRDIIPFWSPLEPILKTGARAITIAERLDMSALRFASTPTAFGWLKQVAGETLSSSELAELAGDWTSAREDGAVGALNDMLDWKESTMDPSRLQLVEARQHSALDLTRVGNIPPWLGGVAVGGMTYSNQADMRAQAVMFGALPYLDVIDQTLSSDRVTAPGRLVRLDRGEWLNNPLLGVQDSVRVTEPVTPAPSDPQMPVPA